MKKQNHLKIPSYSAGCSLNGTKSSLLASTVIARWPCIHLVGRWSLYPDLWCLSCLLGRNWCGRAPQWGIGLAQLTFWRASSLIDSFIFLTLARVLFQTQVVYQAKLFQSKQVLSQVGLIPKRMYTELPLYSRELSSSLWYFLIKSIKGYIQVMRVACTARLEHGYIQGFTEHISGVFAKYNI